MPLKQGIVSLFCLIACVPAFGAGRSSVPPASFLSYHAGTVHDLSQEVTVDPIVRLRLARHFHLTEPVMTSYIRRNLVLSRLTKSGLYQVACVRPDGTEYWVTSRLPVGTPVFASRVTGQPILKLACGNPLVSALPAARAVDSFQAVPPKLADIPAAAPALDGTPALLPGDTVVASALVSDENELLPIVKAAGSLQSLGSAASHAGPFNFAPALAGLAGSIGLISLTGSHHNSPPPLPVTPNAPVPELSTSLSFGAMLLLGSAALSALRRKRA